MAKWAEDNERLRNVIEDSHAKMEDNGPKKQKESVAEAELDEEIRGLQAGEVREQCIAVHWMLHGSDLPAQFPHARSRLGLAAPYASPKRSWEDAWSAASAGASHSSACPGGRTRK